MKLELIMMLLLHAAWWTSLALVCVFTYAIFKFKGKEDKFLACLCLATLVMLVYGTAIIYYHN